MVGPRLAVAGPSRLLRPSLGPCSGNRQPPPLLRPRLLHSSVVSWSGHNKWSKIRHKKAANDTAKSTEYSNISREIIAAIRHHPTKSASPDSNDRLAAILRKARTMDIAKDKLEATLKKAEAMTSGKTTGQPVTYEVLGPLSSEGIPVALIIECQTDSPSRTHGRARAAFNKYDMRQSSTAHMFQRIGVIRLALAKGSTFEDFFDVAVEHGAEDVREWEIEAEEEESEEGVGVVGNGSGEASAEAPVGVEVVCSSSTLVSLTKTLQSSPHVQSILESEDMMLPLETPIQVRGIHDETEGDQDGASSGWLQEEAMTKMDKLLGQLEETVDCTRVWSNIEGWPSR